jgi:hypothetical protein
LTIVGNYIPVKARICTFNSVSAHADDSEQLAWQKRTSAKARSLLMAGRMDQFAAHPGDTHVNCSGRIKLLMAREDL